MLPKLWKIFNPQSWSSSNKIRQDVKTFQYAFAYYLAIIPKFIFLGASVLGYMCTQYGNLPNISHFPKIYYRNSIGNSYPNPSLLVANKTHTKTEKLPQVL